MSIRIGVAVGLVRRERDAVRPEGLGTRVVTSGAILARCKIGTVGALQEMVIRLIAAGTWTTGVASDTNELGAPRFSFGEVSIRLSPDVC